jgi:hypothetical protein
MISGQTIHLTAVIQILDFKLTMDTELSLHPYLCWRAQEIALLRQDYTSVCLFVSLAVYLSVYLSVCLPVCFYVCLFLCLSVCRLPPCLHACLSVCLQTSLCLSVSLSLRLSLFPMKGKVVPGVTPPSSPSPLTIVSRVVNFS